MTTSIVRTLVPMIVGALLGLSVVKQAGITEEQATIVVTALVQFAYYWLARLAEEHLSPRFGWLLGVAKRPEYTPAPPA